MNVMEKYLQLLLSLVKVKQKLKSKENLEGHESGTKQ